MIRKLEIRPALGQDATLLSAIALRSKAHWGYSEEFMAACKDELNYTPKQIEAAHFYGHVCLDGGVPIGFYLLERTSDSIAELDALFVEPEFIGQGVGKLLIDHAKKQAKKLGILTIVIQCDPHAERFYTSIGALPGGTRESGSIPGRQLPLFTIRLRD